MRGTIFVSYACINSDRARQLKEWLEAEIEIPFFLDTITLRGGHIWRAQIKNSLDTSFVVLVLVSRASMVSRNVTFEWSYAMAQGKVIIPLKIQSDLTDAQVHDFLKDSNYVEFVHPSLDDYDRLKIQLNELHKLANVPDEVEQAAKLARSPLVEHQTQAINLLEEYPDDAALRELRSLAKNSTLSKRQINAALALSRRTNHTDVFAVDGLVRAVETSAFQKDGTPRSYLRQQDSDEAAVGLFELIERVQEHKVDGIISTLLEMNSSKLLDMFAELVQRKNIPHKIAMLQYLHEHNYHDCASLLIEYIRTIKDQHEIQYKLYSLLSNYVGDDVVDQLIDGIKSHKVRYYRWEREIVDVALDGLENNASERVRRELIDNQQLYRQFGDFDSRLGRIEQRISKQSE